MSQSMFSFIEKNQYKIHLKYAKPLIERINSFITDNSEKLNTRDLLRSKKENIDFFFKNKILLKIKDKKVDLKLVDKFIIDLQRDKNIEQKIEIFTILSSYFIKNKIKYNIRLIINDAIEELKFSSNSNKKYLNILILNLQRLNWKENKFEKTIELFYKVDHFLILEKKEIFGLIYFNFGLAFQRKNQIEKAIFLYNNSNKYLKNRFRKLAYLNNLGICYLLNNNYNLALEFFLSSYEYIVNEHQKTIYYSNVLLCYINLKEYFSIDLITEKLENLIKNIPNEFKYKAYYCLGKAYYLLENRYNAMINFEKEIDLKIDTNNPYFSINHYKESIEFLFNLYIEKDLKKFNKLEKKILSIPKEFLDSRYLLLIIKNYLSVYSFEDYCSLVDKIEKKLNGV